MEVYAVIESYPEGGISDFSLFLKLEDAELFIQNMKTCKPFTEWTLETREVYSKLLERQRQAAFS